MHGQHQLQIRAAVRHGAAGPHKDRSMLRFLAKEMREVWILPGKNDEKWGCQRISICLSGSVFGFCSTIEIRKPKKNMMTPVDSLFLVA